ncbi:ShlB/FhaC/HecB family hemolysin secretion/activation protein [Sphingomonas profundi]|uniref:ShlB/FhaC/HecB family hemolysin secretion/activation protein n=1 Tax=Alterirhizorhabdus profundi TaxID=2681549 RepID=UPI0012E892FC|nr:ShlB/FhaC/HecB family hemolysin secretion/activation protein [Sphingomonas profundi]
MAIAPFAARAQQAPPAIPANNGLPTREEVTPPPAPPPAERPRLRVDGDIERSACPLADPAYQSVRVTITSATFNNLGPVSPADLAPAYRAYLGTEQPVSVICDIRDAAATLLRRQGYLAAVQVPTQKIEGGNVTFEVLYAKLVAVRVRGDAGRAEGLIAGYLDRLTRDPVFNRFAAERYLLLARDLPGYDVRLALRPTGNAPGELIGDVTVVRTPFEADLNVQNYAARDTGRFGGQLRGQFYGLTGLGDRTTVALYSTADFKEQQILQLGHDFRVGPEGLTFGGRFTYAWTEPDIAAAARLTARTLFVTGEASYPFLRSQKANLRGALGFDYIDQNVRFAGVALSRDRLRVAYLRLDADAIDVRDRPAPAWRLAGSVELRRGLDVFDASRRATAGVIGPSRADGDAEGTLIRANALAEVALVPNVTFSLAPRAQYAFDPLLSFEEFSAGTYTIGRGYDPGTIIGDSGAGFSAELRINRIAPSARIDLALQPFVFVDSAWVWNKDRPHAQRLTSVGGGLRTSFANRFRLDMTLAVPTKRAGLQADRGDTRFLLSLTTKLYPWGSR